MVRILHTGDWHLGQTLRGHSRELEHRAALARVVEIAAEREADAVAGTSTTRSTRRGTHSASSTTR